MSWFMKPYVYAALALMSMGCASDPVESGSIEVGSFSPAEGTKIDCNTTIRYQLKYQISNPQSGVSRTVTASNNQAPDTTYSASSAGGEVSDQIAGNAFYSEILGAKCRKGKVPFSFQFHLKLSTGERLSTKTYLFDEVPNTNCLANTSWC